MANPIVLQLHLATRGDTEEIEDLVASILARHGYRGHIESNATGNTTQVQVRPQVDDGRGYPRPTGVTRGEPAHALLEHPSAGEHVFTFAYRDGEITATVTAASSDAAWAKLRRAADGVDEPGVTFTLGDAQLHTCYWTETTDDDDADADDEGWRDGDDDEPADPIVDRSDDWLGYASADSVDI